MSFIGVFSSCWQAVFGARGLEGKINPDSWHFDVFAYQKYGGTRDFDWLAP